MSFQGADKIAISRGGSHYHVDGNDVRAFIQDNLGTIYPAADILARDSLTGLTDEDTVHVADDGDGKWARYKPTATDANGTGTAWIKIQDQDALDNLGGVTNLGYTSTAVDGTVTSDTGNDATIPAATTSNAGLFIAADKQKVDNISVTNPVNLDVLNTNSHVAATLAGNATDNPLTLTGQELGFNIDQLAPAP